MRKRDKVYLFIERCLEDGGIIFSHIERATSESLRKPRPGWIITNATTARSLKEAEAKIYHN